MNTPEENIKNKIYRITNKEQFVQLIKNNPLLRILTNGAGVFAWKYELACHDEVRQLFPEITDDWTGYLIDNGRLLHSVKIDFPVMDKFLCRWFPDSCERIDEYNRREGLRLFPVKEKLNG